MSFDKIDEPKNFIDHYGDKMLKSMECINLQYSATIFVSCSLRIRYYSVTVFIIMQVGFVILRDTISVNIDHDFSFMQIVTSVI